MKRGFDRYSSGFGALTCFASSNVLFDVFAESWPPIVSGNLFYCLVFSVMTRHSGVMVMSDNVST